MIQMDMSPLFTINKSAPLEVYYGLGARFIKINNGEHNGNLALGPRAPLGINYSFLSPKIDVFGELALAFDILPATNLDLEAGIGARYRF